MNNHSHADEREFASDEGGLRPPPGLSFWRRAWWWFDFIILVKLARLRFLGILLVIGVIITQWDTLNAYYLKWTRPNGEQTAAKSNTEYFCPMHPSIVRDNSKEKCPICFMPLSKRKKGEQTQEVLPDGVVNRVQLSPYRVVLAGVQSWEVKYLSLAKEVNAVGTIEFNERGQTTVSSRVNGRIDELVANETGQMVNAGDVLASIYSPDLVVTMQNLLQAKKANNSALLSDARTRLELLDISKDQIDEILSSGKANTHLKIRSPMSGHIIRKYVKQGQYVQEGMPLYDVVDLSTVWIQAQVYEDDITFLPMNQIGGGDIKDGPEVIATTRSFPNEEFRGRLRFIFPHIDDQTRTLTVRIELPNPGHKLRPGSTANIKLRVAPSEVAAISQSVSKNDEQTQRLGVGEVMAIPEGSVIDTGGQKIVYRESLPGVYEGVEVKLGPRMTNAEGADFYPVLSGVQLGEKVVTSGSFLVDAETRLNPAAGSIYFGGSSGAKGPTSTIVRGTTPEDPDAKINAALAKLPAEDRKKAEAQRFCPILEDSRLGSMGVPIKLTLEGQDVFICCAGCRAEAQENPAKILEKSKTQHKHSAPEATVGKAPPTELSAEEKEITAELGKLSDADRALAEKQRFCPISKDSRLGSMGVPIKLILNDETVFLCCEGCEKSAKKNAAATVDRVRALRAGKVAP